MKLKELFQAYEFDEIYPQIGLMFPKGRHLRVQFGNAYNLLLTLNPVASKKQIRYQLMEDPDSNEMFYGADDHDFNGPWEVLLGKEVKKEMSVLVPYVIEQVAGGERTYDIFSRLLKDRIIFVDKEINDVSADIVVAELLFLESQSSDKDISLYINSPGGSVTAGLAIYDTMQHIKCDVVTICMGMAASMGAFLLAAGTIGKRYALPNAEVMIHQPLGGAQGQASDIEINAREILKIKEELSLIIAKHSGKTLQEVIHSSDRDYWMIASEAKDFGMIDEVLERQK